jgi:ubiquinone biosynthesis protein COQ4
MKPEAIDIDLPAIPSRTPRRTSPFVAWSALRALMRDPDDTERAFDFFTAVDANGFERNFQRFVSHPEGRRLLIEGSDLGGLLADQKFLASLPAESFGATYLSLMLRAGLDPLGLIELQASVEEKWARRAGGPALDPLRAWYRDRFVLVHDLLHVLSGYGTDSLGEAALLAFTHAQVGGRAYGLLAVAASLEVIRSHGPSWIPYVRRAWKRGRSAAWIPALRFEALLELPLSSVRSIARIEAAAAAHPAGVRSGSWSRRANAR